VTIVDFIGRLGPELQTVMASIGCSITLVAFNYFGATVVAILGWLDRRFVDVGIGRDT
jgi:hypothetical protein